MALLELFAADLATTTVASGGTDAPSSGTGETWTVASSAMFGAAQTGVSQFHVADTASGKGTEVIAVTNVSGTTWTVTRGADSTTPVTHAAGFTVNQVATAGWLGGLAQLASPALTGSPTAPTPAGSDSSAKLATTAFAQGAAAAAQAAAEEASDPAGSAATAQSNAETFATAAVAAETSRAEGVEAGLVSLTASQSISGTKAFTGEVTVPTPVNSGDAVPKSYADGIAVGLSIKASVQEATAAALPSNTYSNGSSGVGATLTATANGALTVDGIAVALNDRVLVQNEAAAAHNGIYSVTATGSGSAACVLTRTTDMDAGSQFPGAFTFVEQGTANAGCGFVIASEGPFTVGTTAVNWTKFSSLPVPVPIADGGTGQSTASAALSALGGAAVAGDIGGTSASPQVTSTHLASPLPIAQGGTGTATGAPQNDVFAGPSTGGAGAPSFRALTAGDVPTLNQSTTGTAAGLSSTLGTGSGGTGQTSAAAAYNALSPMTTKGDIEIESSAGTASRLAVGSAGQVLGVSGGLPAWQPALVLQASTGVGGYTLVNGTGNIITWTTPNDGNLHRVLVFTGKVVTSTETGGQCQLAFTDPSGTARTASLFGGNQSAGYQTSAFPGFITVFVQANTAVTFKQSSALTGGASTAWAELWGS